MTRKQFEKLREGDTVVLNGQCRVNKGVRCKVTYICDDRMWVEPVEGELVGVSGYCCPDWNEICYTAVNVV